jgi:L-fucose mutarotase/ribose pyranase (RbsD/FucU family)
MSSEKMNVVKKPKLEVHSPAVAKTLSKFWKNQKYIKKIKKLKNTSFYEKKKQYMTFKISIT